MVDLNENKKFWEQKWVEGKTRFHRFEANESLVKFAPAVFKKNSSVLVPLSGKSLDMIWLKEHGHAVSGVEVAKLPLDEFIKEHNLSGQWRDGVFESDRIKLYHQDFFHHQGKYDAIYDRACLVALNAELRKKMAAAYNDLLKPNGKILLITLERDGLEGPPFNVSNDEIKQLFEKNFEIKKLDTKSDEEFTVTVNELTRRY